MRRRSSKRLLAAPRYRGLLVALLAAAIGVSTAACGGSTDVPTILVTGFGPFGDHATNPSWEAIRGLEGRTIGGMRVRTARLDVDWGAAAAQLGTAVREAAPDVVLCLGVAPGDRIRLEVVARNRDFALTDVAGTRRDAGPIREDGPDLLPTRLPVGRIRDALGAGGYEQRMSEDAGGYLCNHVFYRLLDDLAGDRPAGFVHVPVMGGPWTVERLQEAVVRMIEAITSTS